MSQPIARQGVERVGESPEEYERYRQAQLREYTQWVAAQDIYAGTALAFREGDPVPASTVETQNYDKMGLVKPAQAAASPAPAKTVAVKPADVKE